MNSTFVLCDLETTGLSSQRDKIIEIGLARLEKGKITDTMQTMVNPGRILSLKIKRITGITDDDLSGAPTLKEVLPQVWEFIGDQPIAGHNVGFDIGFLEAAKGGALDNKAYDTLEMARLLLPLEPSFRLESLCRSLNIKHTKAHRALDDALAAAFLLQELITRIHRLDLEYLMQLTGLLSQAKSTWHDYFSSLLSETAKKFPGQKITDKAYWRNNGKSEPISRFPDYVGEKKGTKERTDTELTEEILSTYWQQDGPLSLAIPSYEHRPQQEAMAKSVANAFNSDQYLLLEAGTGVGKSMAYLIPGVLWSLSKNERVVIATHTINLQEQLWRKDIPLLREVVNRDFNVALVKGRQNYICLRRWSNTNAVYQEEAAFFARVMSWLSVTETGDRAELNPLPGEEEYWLGICGEVESCLNYRCSYRQDCFINLARKTAEDADLIITNHSMLLLDIKSNNMILPEYGPLIMDEAHHLEDAATNHLGLRVSRSGMTQWINSTGRILDKFYKTPMPNEAEQWTQTVSEAISARQAVYECSRIFFQLFGEGVQAVSLTKEPAYMSGKITIRLPVDHSAIHIAVRAGEELIVLMDKMLKVMNRLISTLEWLSVTTDAYLNFGQELSQVYQSGNDLASDLAFILASEEDTHVYWTDVDFSNDVGLRQCVLHAAPIDVGEILYERFYKNRKSVVFTSATLSISGSFKHFIDRSGLSLLPDSVLVSAGFDSPFDYDNQSMLFLHNTLPVQGAITQPVYLDELATVLEDLLCVTQGRTLVLFTSHMVLRETYYRVQAKLEEHNIVVFGHGIDGSRNRILEDFKSNSRSVLFGASSFWEGVDVQGESLSCVVIVKLPFWSPKIPVIEARIAALERNHRNSFMEFSVPQAVVRFKQGFGRLIRSCSDRGCVVVLDSRIVQKRYGRLFLQSLPVKSHLRGGTELLTKKISGWIPPAD